VSIGDESFSTSYNGASVISFGALPLLETIGYRSFQNMQGILNFEVGDSCANLVSIGDESFSTSYNGASVISFGALPLLETIGSGSFSNMPGILNFEPRDSCSHLVTIGDIAFGQISNTESVVRFGKLPLLQLIGTNAFQNMRNTLIFQPGACTLTSIGTNAFSGITNTESVITFGALPHLQSVGDLAFNSFKGQLSLNADDCSNLVKIGMSSFAGITQATSIISFTNLQRLESIADSAFQNYKGILILDGGASPLKSFPYLTFVGTDANPASAFNGTTNPESIVYLPAENSVPLLEGALLDSDFGGTIEYGTNDGCHVENGDVPLTRGLYEQMKNMSGANRTATEQEISCVPATEFVKYGSDVTLGALPKLVKIYGSAFRGFANTLIIGAMPSLTTISHDAFNGVSGKVTIAAGECNELLEISHLAFTNVYNVESLVTFDAIPALLMIGWRAFQGFRGVLNISFGDMKKLKKISFEAFDGITNASSAVSFGALPALQLVAYSAFLNFAGVLTLAAGECLNLTVIETAAFESVSNLASSVSFGATAALTTIGASAFKAMKGELTFAAGDVPLFTKFESSTFAGCINPKSSITFTSLTRLKSIDAAAFNVYTGTLLLSGDPDFPNLVDADAVATDAFDGTSNTASIVILPQEEEIPSKLKAALTGRFRGTVIHRADPGSPCERTISTSVYQPSLTAGIWTQCAEDRTSACHFHCCKPDVDASCLSCASDGSCYDLAFTAFDTNAAKTQRASWPTQIVKGYRLELDVDKLINGTVNRNQGAGATITVHYKLQAGSIAPDDSAVGIPLPQTELVDVSQDFFVRVNKITGYVSGTPYTTGNFTLWLIAYEVDVDGEIVHNQPDVPIAFDQVVLAVWEFEVVAPAVFDLVLVPATNEAHLLPRTEPNSKSARGYTDPTLSNYFVGDTYKFAPRTIDHAQTSVSTLFVDNITYTLSDDAPDSMYIQAENGVIFGEFAEALEYRFQLIAVDAGGQKQVVENYTFLVTVRDDFRVASYEYYIPEARSESAYAFSTTNDTSIDNDPCHPPGPTDLCTRALSKQPYFGIRNVSEAVVSYQTLYAGVTVSLPPINQIRASNNASSKFTFTMIDAPPGFFIDPQTGELVGVPRLNRTSKADEDNQYITTLFAVDRSGGKAPLETIQFTVIPNFDYVDVDTPNRGPNNKVCEHGTIRDGDPFDNKYTCDCTNTMYQGENCEISKNQECAINQALVGGYCSSPFQLAVNRAGNRTAGGPEFTDPQTMHATYYTVREFASYRIAPLAIDDVRTNYSIRNQTGVTYTTKATLDGFFLNKETGQLLGTFDNFEDNKSATKTFEITVQAIDANNIHQDLETITMRVRYPDVEVEEYGPNNQTCQNEGKHVDGVNFDRSFVCLCTGTGYEGDNCETAIKYKTCGANEALIADVCTPFQLAVNRNGTRTKSGTEFTNLTTMNSTYYTVREFESYRIAPLEIDDSRTNYSSGTQSNVTYTMTGAPVGFFLNTQTGQMLGTFDNFDSDKSATKTFKITLQAIDENKLQQIMEVITMRVRYPDLEVDEYGPNNQRCKNNGTPMDGLDGNGGPYDQSYVCKCPSASSSTSYSGENCELATAIQPAASTSDVTPVVSTSVVAGGLMGAFAIVLMVLYVGHRFRIHRIKMQAIDFEEHVKRLTETGELDIQIADGEADGVAKTPREIKRDHLTLIETIGKGAFGAVWKCTLDETATGGTPSYLVAAKTVLDIDSKPEARDELVSEAIVMAQLTGHLNVVSLVGVITRGDPLVLILSYCEHGSLLSYVRGQHKAGTTVYLEVKRRLLMEVACGMQHLASSRYIHRDLAARNVLIASGLVAQVADFGLSRGGKRGGKDATEEDNTDDTDAGEAAAYYRSKTGLFPVRWTAPEAMNEGLFTTASDVWSFGIVAVEAIQNGNQPYGDWSVSFTMTRVIGGFKHKQPTDCPDDLYAIMLPCWENVPSDRPSFANLAAALRASMGEAGTTTVNANGTVAETNMDAAGYLKPGVPMHAATPPNLPATTTGGNGVAATNMDAAGYLLPGIVANVAGYYPASGNINAGVANQSQSGETPPPPEIIYHQCLYARMNTANAESGHAAAAAQLALLPTIPMVTLEAAVQLMSVHCQEDLQVELEISTTFANVYMVSERGQRHARGLETVHVAAIHLYTQESPVYKYMNGALGGWGKGGTAALSNYIPYIRLLTVAMSKLPKVELTCYRGVTNVPLDIILQGCGVGDTLVSNAVTSCSASPDVLQDPVFLGFDPSNQAFGVRVVFVIQVKTGVRVEHFSDKGKSIPLLFSFRSLLIWSS
jgi:serine/threonine protein kinase